MEYHPSDKALRQARDYHMERAAKASNLQANSADPKVQAQFRQRQSQEAKYHLSNGVQTGLEVIGRKREGSCFLIALGIIGLPSVVTAAAIIAKLI